MMEFTPENVEKLPIQELFATLEEIMTAMEKNEEGLEKNFALYQQGMLLVRTLNGKIDGIEKKLEILDAGEETAR